MSLGVGKTLKGGLQRTVAPTGLQFAALWVVYLVVGGILFADILPAASTGPRSGPSLGLPPGVAFVLWLPFGFVLGTVILLAALRTFVNGDTKKIPGTYFTRNVGSTLANLIVGNIVFVIAVGVGFVLLIIPGLYLLWSLLFWMIFVAVEDESFIEGFRSSWDLTKGHRLTLFGIGVIVVVIYLVVAIPLLVLQFVLPGTLWFFLYQATVAVFNIFMLGTLTAAYTQLTEDEAESAAADTSI